MSTPWNINHQDHIDELIAEAADLRRQLAESEAQRKFLTTARDNLVEENAKLREVMDSLREPKVGERWFVVEGRNTYGLKIKEIQGETRYIGDDGFTANLGYQRHEMYPTRELALAALEAVRSTANPTVQ